ncbi:Periplasmic thiol:disulfide oxidoreductase DsbB, required for DsbA reoxidation [hydrothermal vent metagenome]|uniref:Periplasmic thiol:disulfide oxidoreductase DsbB, required for DsbA reoxidation n=1 Tax=hydrothermal vent metagenome TaxID=652676 RepID=A0A3B0SGT2_9ZZZZ
MILQHPLITRHWPLLAALISAAMLATAHGFEHFAHLAPCELCYRQREVYWLALVLGLVVMLVQYKKPASRMMQGGLALLGLVFLTGALVAGYHAGVEWKFWPGPSSCTGSLAELANMGADLLNDLSQPSDAPKCDQIPWAMFGLSMAGWNALISLVLAAISFQLALSRPKQQVTL